MPRFLTVARVKMLIALFGFITVLIAANSVNAEQILYSKTQTVLFSTAGDDTTIAAVSPGVMLKVLETKGERVKVEITGWSPQGGERYLFIAINQRILQAKMINGEIPQRKIIAEKEDYYESIWQDVSLTGWVAVKDTDANIADIWKATRKLFHQRCTRCHSLHRPTEFTANQWPSILKIMTVRAGLSGGRKALIVQFMQTHAKDQKLGAEEPEETAGQEPEDDPQIPKITGDARLAKAGAKLFVDNNCNACHGDDAQSPAIPAYPKLAGQSADYAYKQMQDFKSKKRSNDEYEVMQENLAELSDSDMQAIAWWLSTQ